MRKLRVQRVFVWRLASNTILFDSELDVGMTTGRSQRIQSRRFLQGVWFSKAGTNGRRTFLSQLDNMTRTRRSQNQSAIRMWDRAGGTGLLMKRSDGRSTASNRVFHGGEPGARSRRGVLGGVATGKEEARRADGGQIFITVALG